MHSTPLAPACAPACEDAREQVNEYVDGALHDPSWMVSHLEQCPACARVAQQLLAQRARLLRVHAKRVADHALNTDDASQERAPAALVARVRTALARRSA